MVWLFKERFAMDKGCVSSCKVMEVVMSIIVIKDVVTVVWMWGYIWDFISGQPWFWVTVILPCDSCILQVFFRWSCLCFFLVAMVNHFWKRPSVFIDKIVGVIMRVRVVKSMMSVVWMGAIRAINAIFPFWGEGHMSPSIIVDSVSIVVDAMVIDATAISNSMVHSP